MIKSLTGKIDFYRCMHIKTTPLPENFPQVLEESLIEWSKQQLKAIWLLIPNSQIELTGICRNYGFYPHHVNESGIMMAKWLDNNKPNSLPAYSTHYTGVGGVVLTTNNQVLLVKNRYSGIGISTWRIPGGLVNVNELLMDGAVREVYEETNIKAKPLGIIGFREKMNYQFNRPDIYFLVLLEPLSFKITMDPEEITDCQWMDFNEWINSNHPGDAKTMMISMYTNKSMPPYQYFRNFCLNFCKFDYKSPYYTATHYCHLQMLQKININDHRL